MRRLRGEPPPPPNPPAFTPVGGYTWRATSPPKTSPPPSPSEEQALGTAIEHVHAAEQLIVAMAGSPTVSAPRLAAMQRRLSDAAEALQRLVALVNAKAPR